MIDRYLDSFSELFSRSKRKHDKCHGLGSYKCRILQSNTEQDGNTQTQHYVKQSSKRLFNLKPDKVCACK